jgi:hypothetical protein
MKSCLKILRKIIGTATIDMIMLIHGGVKIRHSLTNAPGCNTSRNQYIASTLFNLQNNLIFSGQNTWLLVLHVGSKAVYNAEMLGMGLRSDPPRVRTRSLWFISMEGILRECDIITSRAFK